eukprot:TRINITY_DN48535_c0_g1_i2.p1 TRINITY_DN48535_c0_g1~~TRINITY_DN48535_c0_g1_i2.p1  ORF type:complete len:141 (+),score=23.02 TRINITY_DN48535_c0_g1_i2:41-424(+)
MYTVAFVVVYIVTIIGVGLRTWKIYDDDTSVQVGLWQIKTDFGGETVEHVKTKCEYEFMGMTQKLLTGTDCGYYEGARTFVIFKVVLGAFALGTLAYAIVKRRLQLFQIGRAVQQECRDRSRMPSSA